MNISVSCRTEDILLTVDHLAKMIDSATTQDCPKIIGRLEELKVKASLRLTASQSFAAPSIPEKERYLGVEEVAARFHVSPKWLYRHKRHLPHSQPTRKTLLFPEQAITKWFASRKRHD